MRQVGGHDRLRGVTARARHWVALVLTVQGLGACAAGRTVCPEPSVRPVTTLAQRKACDEYGVVPAQLHDGHADGEVVTVFTGMAAYNPMVLAMGPVAGPAAAYVHFGN
jgi:hypothetical protein